ncbi:MAG: T9SS type A sorting domain-containing protein [Candidatus Eisenbacteria bacterium]|nr:T9SS type A sorting domain-containing protein [Candidatus Eisenbacteria bacterium]
MNRNAALPLALTVIFCALAVAGDGQAVELTFQVRMSYQIELGNFDPAEDFVDLAGTFNDWGTDPLTPLADADGDTIYEVTLDGFSPSAEIEYKYRLNGQWDGTEEFPGVGNNRHYTVPATDDTILVWYNDLEPGGGYDPSQLGWWNDCVFYEIFVRSFYDSDGDGIGDFPGLTQKLDYLNDGDPGTDDDLGVTGIWLMPIQDSPSYHGYDGVDYRSINPDYGTMADFQTFLAAAHDRGIKVIIDYVMNHCSNQHPWFVESAQGSPGYRDYFRWSESDPGYTGPWGQNVWHWHPSDWYYGLFTSGMPDLNYENSAVRDSMFQIADYWLDTVGVDGFRLDAVLYIHEDGDQLQNTPATFAFWEDYNAHVKSVKPDAFSVGEAWTGTSTILQYSTEDRLDTCFEFNLAYATLGSVNDANAEWVKSKANEVYNLYPYLQYATFLTNHDQDRSFTVFGEDEDKARVAAGMYLTLPGVPFLYYGEEIGMTGSGDHLNIRTPMQWTDGAHAGFTTGTPWRSVNGNYVDHNVAEEEQDPGSLLEWYKRLIHLRNESPALRRGLHHRLETSETPVLAFARSSEQETVLCMINASPDPVSAMTLSGFAGALEPGDYTFANMLLPGDTLNVSVTSSYEVNGLDLTSYEVAVYELIGGTGVDPGDDDSQATRLQLEQSYPNPFGPSTTISYALPQRTHVKLSVYDVVGREVAVLRDETQAAGEHEARWDGTNENGQDLAAGMYFVRLDAGGDTRTSKVTLVR